jgi:hypothetical protein
MLSAARRSKPSSASAIEELPCRVSLSIHLEFSAANHIRTLWVIALLILLAKPFLRRLYRVPAVTEQKPTVYCHGPPGAKKVPGGHRAFTRRAGAVAHDAARLAQWGRRTSHTDSRAQTAPVRDDPDPLVEQSYDKREGCGRFFCDTEETRDMTLAKTPTYIGVRLPLGLRLWLEMGAGEE